MRGAGLVDGPLGELVGPPLSARAHHGRLGLRLSGVCTPRGPSMSPAPPSQEPGPSAPPPRPGPFAHVPVLADEVVAMLAPAPAGWVADCTLGGGGHAAALLDAAPHLSVLGIDRDADAIEAASGRLSRFGTRVRTVQARFDTLAEVCRAEGIDRLSGALFDLGVSSPQLDRPERGFSHRADAALDMRMDRGQDRTAADVVNATTGPELEAILRTGGEERFAGRVARAIVAARPVTTTGQLADLVRSAIPAPARRRGGDPANRAFQAIRIAVNGELDVLAPALSAAVHLLVPGGRLVVLAYHSGEDRIAKHVLADAADGGCTCPPGLPCACGAVPTIRLVRRKATTAAAQEVTANRRAAPVRLRVAERLATPAPGGSARA